MDKLAKRAKSTLFAEVVDQFLALHGTRLKASTREVYGVLICLHLKPVFGLTPTSGEISRAAVASYHAKNAATPRSANHALAVLSKIMSWAEE